MTGVFITSSGTEIGKTFVTCALIHQLRTAGQRVAALKPVASGFDVDAVEETDTGVLLSALNCPLDQSHIESISPWRFIEPLSPDMAAARENRSIPFGALTEFCTTSRAADVTLIEGIGGVMVPLDETHTVLDWIIAVGAPVLLVTGGYLGSLSHTLTALGMLQSHQLQIAGILVNESEEQPVSLDETAAVLRRFSGSVPVVSLPRLPSYTDTPDLLPLLEDYL